MYKKIKDTYGTPGVAVVFSDFKKVLTFSLNADHNPRPAIDALQVLFDRLRTNEVDLPEFVRAMILTHAIPKSWDSIAALQMQGKAVGDIKFTTIRDAIVSEYERRANPAALNKMTNLKRKQHNPSFAQQKNSSQGPSQGSSSKSNAPPKEQGQKKNNARGKRGNKGKGKQPAHSHHGHSLDVSTILSPAILTSHPSPLPASSASIAEISSAGINVRKVAVNLPASAYSAAAAKVDQPPSGARYPSLDYARRQCELLNIPKHAQYLRMFEDQWRARMNRAKTPPSVLALADRISEPTPDPRPRPAKRAKTETPPPESESEVFTERETTPLPDDDMVSLGFSDEEINDEIGFAYEDKKKALDDFDNGFFNNNRCVPKRLIQTITHLWNQRSLRLDAADLEDDVYLDLCIALNYIVSNHTVSTCDIHCLKCRAASDLVQWILDSGASIHVTNDLDDFSSYKAITNSPQVQTAGKGHTISIVGVGTVFVKHWIKAKEVERKLFPVFYIPKLDKRLILLGVLLQTPGHYVHGDATSIGVYNISDEVVFECNPMMPGETIYWIETKPFKLNAS
jgi:hypothetical protein